jgi:hypothetical protein
MKCALTKALPFVLTLCIGAALGSFQWRRGFQRDSAPPRQTTPGRATQHSRTWLVIHHQPPPDFPSEAATGSDEPCSARLRVRFDADGTVSEAISEDAAAPEGCVAAAVEAAGRIRFTPASENGKPVSVVASVSYGFSEMRIRVLERNGSLSCRTNRQPVSSPIEIVSVEGASESEGWRVVYE